MPFGTILFKIKRINGKAKGNEIFISILPQPTGTFYSQFHFAKHTQHSSYTHAHKFLRRQRRFRQPPSSDHRLLCLLSLCLNLSPVVRKQGHPPSFSASQLPGCSGAVVVSTILLPLFPCFVY